MDKAQKGSKNMHGVAAKKEIIYEINRELRKKEIQKKGLTSNPLANMVLCEDLIIKQDMELRQGIDGDTDLSCLGVVRKNDWCNGVKVYLWNRISLDILMQFSLNGRLVLHIDSTKYGSFGLHNSTNDSKKVLFTPLSIQPGDGFVKQDDKDLFYREYFKGLVLAEMVSNKNKTDDVAAFLTHLAKDCEAYTGHKLRPRMIHTDEAGQLKNGILAVFAKEGQVRNQIMYANMCTLLYLRLADKMSHEINETGDWVESAKWALQIHDQFSGCGIHDCASHVYRNTAEWPKRTDREQDAPEVKAHESQFVSMFQTFANGVKDMDDISEALSHVCALMAIMSVETLPCNNFDIDSDVEKCYDVDWALEIAENMMKFISGAAISIRTLSDDLLMKQLNECMQLNDKSQRQQRFMGDKYCLDIFDKMIRGMSFSMTILREKDVKKRKGVIEVVVVHWPYDKEGNLSPQCVDGFTESVDLPYEGEKLGIESKAGVRYIDKQFRRHGALWAATGPSILSKALNMTNKASNQHLEGVIGNNKNNVKDMKSVHAREPGTYMHRFWDALRKGADNMMMELARCDEYIDHRREWERNKSLKNEEGDEEDKTEDYKEMEDIDNSDMVWDRKAKEQWKLDEIDLRRDVTEALRLNGVTKAKGKSKMQEALLTFGGKDKRGKWFFMSKPTFNKWYEGGATKPLKKEHLRIIQAYIKKTNEDKDNDDC